MAVPALEAFLAFQIAYDHIRPIGWPTAPAALDIAHTTELQTMLARTQPGRWLQTQENFRQALRRLTHSAFYRALPDEGMRTFARTRLAIDATCAIGEYLTHRQSPPGAPSTRADRRKAQTHAEALRALMRKGIDLPSQARTDTLYWGLYDLEQELNAQLQHAHPIARPQRRDKNFAERTLAHALAQRFLAAFGEPLRGAIQNVIEIVAPGKLDEKSIRNVCADLQKRRSTATEPRL